MAGPKAPQGSQVGTTQRSDLHKERDPCRGGPSSWRSHHGGVVHGLHLPLKLKHPLQDTHVLAGCFSQPLSVEGAARCRGAWRGH